MQSLDLNPPDFLKVGYNLSLDNSACLGGKSCVFKLKIWGKPNCYLFVVANYCGKGRCKIRLEHPDAGKLSSRKNRVAQVLRSNHSRMYVRFSFIGLG
jgi:hypothetical protein